MRGIVERKSGVSEERVKVEGANEESGVWCVWRGIGGGRNRERDRYRGVRKVRRSRG